MLHIVLDPVNISEISQVYPRQDDGLEFVNMRLTHNLLTIQCVHYLPQDLRETEMTEISELTGKRKKV